MNIQKILLAPALVAGALAVPTAMAATSAPANLTVQLVINASCTINAATLTFPAQATLSTVTDANAPISLTCTYGTPYNIKFNLGLYADGGARRMKKGADYAKYEIYREEGRTTVLGSTESTNTIAATGTGSADTKTVYGRVPVQTNVPAGSYSDTVQMTVSY